MKFNMPEGVVRALGRQTLMGRKHSPTMLFGAGVVGVVSSTVLACRATLKVEEVLEKTQGDLRAARGMEHPEYSEQDRKRDVAIIYTRSVVAVGKLYAPAIVVGGLGIAALTGSHTILTRRNAALTAAYGVLEKGFQEYRERVIEKYGEDEDRQFRFPRESSKELNPETGKQHTVVHVAGESPSVYAKFFDEYSTSWSREPEYNLTFLRCQQNWFNDLLKVRGHVFLNEVYDALGIPRTKAGSVVGWVVSKNGDNFVDFGVFERDTEQVRHFINGREGSILLDFNVDGIIYDKIGDEA